ncbi:hypothetical protein N7U66_00720 [Lacinutrix neustonica]|uniref:Uncharacterized protein n=1 Tax=Lacinutrix neustonica TaxID=2980107 RepID=A0A9E8SDP3_9FLAO|nr:hypothetical protein [Lacinutrix neustonica]WAC02316.1 hypothetical protein N7U66_00720 [Lacinutrix neustonica]
MKDNKLVNDIKFWVDQNVIHCSIPSGFEANSLEMDLEAVFFNAISTLSNGKYLPLLIDMEAIEFSLSIKLFKFLSKNSLIKTVVLSKTFLVNSLILKAFLSLHNFTYDPVVPNTIFNDFSSAIKCCNKNVMVFNALS